MISDRWLVKYTPLEKLIVSSLQRVKPYPVNIFCSKIVV